MTTNDIKRLFGLDTNTGRARSCKPGLERLETLQLMAAGAISGHAFLDADNNGRLDPGEAPSAGSTIELKNAAGVVVGSTRTDADGLFSFSTDQTAGGPATLTKSASLPSDLTNYDKTVSLPRFDPALGALTAVEVTFSGSITSSIQTENLSGTSTATIGATATGVLNAEGPGVHLSIPLSIISGSFDAATYDGAMDFDGPSGHDFGPLTASGSQSTTLTDAATLAAFTGTGTVDTAVSASARASSEGGGSLATNATTTATAGVTVTYHYTPSNALAPGRYTVVKAGTTAAIGVTLGTGGSTGNNFADAAPAPSLKPSITIAQNIPARNVGPVTITSSSWAAPGNQLATLVVAFSGNPDPSIVSNLAKYRLVAVGPNGRPVGNAIKLIAAVYNAETRTLTLKSRAPLNAQGSYLLTAAGLNTGSSSRTPVVAVFNRFNLSSAPTPSLAASASAHPTGPKVLARRGKR